MKTKYFANVKTAEEAKKLYRELSLKNHPDMGGDLEVMKAINIEFSEVWEKVKNIRTNSSNETYEKETAETAQEFMDAIKNIIHLEGIKIEIIGLWVWVTGNTFPYKEILKENGYMFSKNKKAWYYTGEEKATKKRGNYTMDQIKDKFNVQSVKIIPQPKLG